MQTCNMVQAGYGERTSTPDNPSEMVGFYRPDNRSRGREEGFFEAQGIGMGEAGGVMSSLIVS